MLQLSNTGIHWGSVVHALQEAGQELVKSAKKAAQSKVLHKYPASKRQHSNMYNAVKKKPSSYKFFDT